MSTIVDLSFPLRGRTVRRDHGYPLYAALSRAVPAIHGAAWLMIHPIRGEAALGERIRLREWSAISLRLPLEQLEAVLPLSGALLAVADANVALGAPRIEPLRPSPSVVSRTTVVRVTRAPRTATGVDKDALQHQVKDELARQLAAIPARGDIIFQAKREIVVGSQRILGWSVRVDGLSDEDSLALQMHGLGGKHRMGCGIFVPATERS